MRERNDPNKLKSLQIPAPILPAYWYLGRTTPTFDTQKLEMHGNLDGIYGIDGISTAEGTDSSGVASSMAEGR